MKERYLLYGVIIGIITSSLPSIPEVKKIFDGNDKGQKEMVTLSYLIVLILIVVVMAVE